MASWGGDEDMDAELAAAIAASLADQASASASPPAPAAAPPSAASSSSAPSTPPPEGLVFLPSLAPTPPPPFASTPPASFKPSKLSSASAFSDIAYEPPEPEGGLSTTPPFASGFPPAAYGSAYGSGYGSGSWYAPAAPAPGSAVKKTGSPGAPKPDMPVIMVSCPMCGGEVPEEGIEAHIDTCLEDQATQRAIEDAKAGPKWACVFCSWMNTAKEDKCARCFGRKHDPASPTKPVEGVESKEAVIPKRKCQICEEESDSVVITGLCQHLACRSCLGKLVLAKISEEDLFSKSLCPIEGCGLHLSIEALRSLSTEVFWNRALWDISQAKFAELKEKYGIELSPDEIDSSMYALLSDSSKEGTARSLADAVKIFVPGAESLTGSEEIVVKVSVLIATWKKMFEEHSGVKISLWRPKESEASARGLFSGLFSKVVSPPKASSVSPPVAKEKPKGLHGSKGVGYDGAEGLDIKSKKAIVAKREKALQKDNQFAMIVDALTFTLKDMTLEDLHVLAVLHHSALVKLLVEFFQQDSIMGLASRASLVGSLLNLCRTLSTSGSGSLFALLRPNGRDMKEEVGDHKSVFRLLSHLRTQAKLFLKSPEELLDSMGADAEGIGLFGIASDIIDVASVLESCAKLHVEYSTSMTSFGSAGSEESKYSSKPVDDEVKVAGPVDVSEYIEKLRSLSFATMDLLNNGFYFSKKGAEDSISAASAGAGNKKRLMRIRKEIASLSSSLPDGIFLRVDEDRFDAMRFAIVGPEDSPYENGFFLFDMLLPASYPSVPPKVKFLTTGKGQFRFNPNLYAEGKVCLSLLGTWSGPGWDPEESTILQVLVSIQAFILCAEPYYNEPGWVSHKGTPYEKDAHAYHRLIREATLAYAMVWQLESLPVGFEEVVKTHFKCTRHKIEQQLNKWEQENARAPKTTSCYGELRVQIPWNEAKTKMQSLVKSLD